VKRPFMVVRQCGGLWALSRNHQAQCGAAFAEHNRVKREVGFQLAVVQKCLDCPLLF
jgi:hypothetical protein